MRLGKTRNWAAAGRRLFGQPAERLDGALAAEERNALLGANAGASAEPFAGPDEEPMLAGDPTQHLLTALGRFHRQVVKAKSASSQEEWCEECMNQIIAGIEIALAQNWGDVQEALTDAARILLSYEEAGRAQDCVSFLQDGYEILCLMVGDLIVDNVRSGVMVKWRRRYQMAVEELLKAGLVLVEDEAEEESGGEAPVVSESLESAPYSVEEEVKAPAWEEEPFEDSAEEASVEESVAPVQEESGKDEETCGPEEDHPDILFEDEPIADAEETPFTETVPSSSIASSEASLTVEWEQGDRAPFAEPEPPDTIIPALHENLALFPASESMAEAGETPEYPEWRAEPETGEEAAQEERESVEPETEETPDGRESVLAPAFSPLPEDREKPAPPQPVELTFDFDAPAAPAEKASFSTDEELSAIIASLSAEAAEAARKIQKMEEKKPEAAVVETSAPAPVLPAASASAMPASAPPLAGRAAEAEERFRVTHEAMLRGNVADAKVLALKLAADMAQLEVDRGETQVSNRQTRIEVDDHGIAGAEEEARAVEKALRDTEWHSGELQAEFLPKREHVNALRGQIAAIDNGIADVEAQIRDLEARRDQEVRRKRDTEGELDAAVTEESRIQTALDNLAEVDRATREQLGAHTAELERRKAERAAHQSDLDVAVEELAARRNSLREIRRMVELLGGK